MESKEMTIIKTEKGVKLSGLSELTTENYKDNHDYVSYSRISRFLDCEAATAAGYHEETTTAQLLGSALDSLLTSQQEYDKFKIEHPEMFNSKTGEPKKDFTRIQDYYNRTKSDELLNKFTSAPNQVIMVGVIEGLPFKIKMDNFDANEFIFDYKLMKDYSDVYVKGVGYQPFAIAYKYDLELAIFQEIVRQNIGKKLPCYIGGVTKQEPSDVGVFKIGQNQLDKALTELKERILPRYKKVMNGEVAPVRCCSCEYCRKTKKAKIIDFDLAGCDGRTLKEMYGIINYDPKVEKKGEK